MKKTKILAPALGILALSLAASVTGTVAWFSTSSSVSANGMNIKAQVASNLYIKTSGYSGGAFVTAPDADNIIAAHLREVSPILTNWNASTPTVKTQAVGMIPTSTVDYESWQFVALNEGIEAGGQVFSSNPSAGVFSSAAATGANTLDSLKPYVCIGQFHLALGDVAGKPINMTCHIVEANATGDDTLLNAVRVAVKWTTGECTDPNFEKGKELDLDDQLFTGSRTNDISYRPMAANGTLGAEVTAKKCETAYNLGTMTHRTTYTATIYAWFEGQDEACVNLNSIYAGDYEISFDFNVGEAK